MRPGSHSLKIWFAQSRVLQRKLNVRRAQFGAGPGTTPDLGRRVVLDGADCTGLEHFADTSRDDGILTKRYTHERFIEAEGAQDWQGIGGKLTGALVSGSDHATCARL